MTRRWIFIRHVSDRTVETTNDSKVSTMSDESLHVFLHRRERELVHQIAALRGQLAPKEAELAEIRRVRASLTLAGGNFLNDLHSVNDLAGLTAAGGDSPARPDQPVPASKSSDVVGRSPMTSAMSQELTQRFAKMTIKELVAQALLDHFPSGGTATQIRDFIRDAYGRTIEASSLRPQLSRLKADGVTSRPWSR